MKENQVYKNDALAALKGRWPQAVLAALAYICITLLFLSPYELSYMRLLNDPTNLALAARVSNWSLLYLAGLIFLIFPITIGLANSFKKLLLEGDDRVVGNMFKITFGNYWHYLWGNLLCKIFASLWSLLLIVPGIIKVLSYAMTSYILVDRPELSANQAINLSKRMMRGHKFDLFYLYLSFIGWIFLCFLTLGIGLVWFLPYAQTAEASFYEDVKAEYESRAGESI